MRKSIDLLSRDLAGGMSRRKALWRFMSGLATVGTAGVLGSRQAKAASVASLQCQIFCNTQSQALLKICRTIAGNNVAREAACNLVATEFLAACVAASGKCRSGLCAEFAGINGSIGIDAASYSLFVDGGGDFICAPPGVIPIGGGIPV